MEITTNSTKDTNAAVELQRQARARALEHGHTMGEWEQRVGGRLESACADCGFHIGVLVNANHTYGLALTKKCSGTGREAA